MSRLFPIIRAALLGAVTAWTLIVLGIAIHFQMTFQPSQELIFVPLAVFAAAATLTVFIVLFAGGCIDRLKPVFQTRWELLWIGLLAILWFALGGITAQPETAEYEVECWEEEDGVVVADNVDGYSNDVYHARYRVLQAFAFFNAILLLGLFLFILTLAIWHHKRGRWVIWTTPTTLVGWFDKGTSGKGLPPPVTDKQRGRSREKRYKQLAEENSKKYTTIPGLTRKVSGTHEPLLPKEYTMDKGVWVPPKKDTPIAQKMTQVRNAPVVAPAAARRPSQRQTADVARTEARRERAARDDSAPPRPSRQQTAPAARHESTRRTGADTRPSDLRRADTTPSRPAVARQASTPALARPTEPRRQGLSQPQPTRPAVARQGSSAQRPPPPGRRI